MSHLLKIYHHIKSDTFLRNNAIFFVGSLFIAFLNYLYYPVMGRVMSVEQFGEIQTIFSLVYLSGVVLTVFRMIVLHITANESDQPQKVDTGSTLAIKNPSSTTIIPPLYTAALYIHVPFILVLLFGSPLISRFFSFETSWTFSIFGVYLFTTVAATFYSAYLHGKNDFSTLTISQIIGAAGKLILSFIFVYLGFGVFGAVFGLALISLVTIIYMKKKSGSLRLPLSSLSAVMKVLRHEYVYGFLIFVSLGFVTILYSLDVLIIKRLFSPEVAGLYSGVITIARIIYFVTGSISGVLISSVTLRDDRGTNKKSLIKALLLILGIGGGVLIFFILFPTFVISLMVGSKYAAYAHFLPVMSFYLFLVSLLNLFVSYLLAIRSYSLFPITLIGVLVLLSSLYLHHETVDAVLLSFTLSTGVALVLSAVKVFSYNHQK